MTAEEYVKHYASGQGGYESVPVDIALRAIEYAKREAKQQMMTKAIDAQCFGFQGAALFSFRLPVGNYLVGSEVKVIVIKED
jgi:hypothetical protein